MAIFLNTSDIFENDKEEILSKISSLSIIPHPKLLGPPPENQCYLELTIYKTYKSLRVLYSRELCKYYDRVYPTVFFRAEIQDILPWIPSHSEKIIKDGLAYWSENSLCE